MPFGIIFGINAPSFSVWSFFSSSTRSLAAICSLFLHFCCIRHTFPGWCSRILDANMRILWHASVGVLPAFLLLPSSTALSSSCVGRTLFSLAAVGSVTTQLTRCLMPNDSYSYETDGKISVHHVLLLCVPMHF